MSGNLLIDQLPRVDRLRLLALMEATPLHVGTILCRRGKAAGLVYFPTEGAILLSVPTNGQGGLGVGLVGREGMLGVHLVLGLGLAPWTASVHAEGSAWRLRAAAFRRECARSPALQRSMLRHAGGLMTELVGQVGCVSRHLIGSRLARWLLMSRDRADSDRLRLTHQVLADLLGVRRVGITMAAGVLQQQGLIRYHRGEVTLLDRAGLEAVSCPCAAGGPLVGTVPV